VAKLAERFVPVRMQSMNGQNINLFQFEFDLTWMAFFMDAQDRFYARYGGRDDAGAEAFLTKGSLIRTMERVLELHQRKQVQKNKYEPNGRPLRTPEDIPGMAGQMKGRKERCIHCHDVKAAVLRDALKEGRFTKDLVFTYPSPANVGLIVNRDRQDCIDGVKPASPAERAGIKVNDSLVSIDGQRILTAADLSRVLELAPKEATLPIQVRRGDATLMVNLTLSGDWKRTADPSWRSSTHWAGPNGGFWGMPLSESEKQRLGIAGNGLGLRINFFFKNHPSPMNAGLRNNDILVELDGLRTAMTPRQVHTHLQLNRAYGDKVPIVILRDGKELKLTLELPDKPTWE
jgi:hypothetical protein